MKTRLYSFLLVVFCLQAAAMPAQQVNEKSAAKDSSRLNKSASALRTEFRISGAWESRHNLVDRVELKLTVPAVNLALRCEVLDRRPASDAKAFKESFGGETAGKAISQAGLGLYHVTSGSRFLYGVLDSYGLPARIRNVWIRGSPYAQSREESGAELKTAPSSAAAQEAYACLGTNGISAGKGLIRLFVSFAAYSDEDNKAPSVNAGLSYERGKALFALEGYYTGRTLPERTSSTWFNEKPALPERNTRLFAGSALVNLKSFALSADLSYSETFAFGSDFYGNVGLRIGDKPWRFSLAFDAAGSRYVDSAGSNPGAGFRAAAKLERWGKKTGLFRVNAVFRGPGPDMGFLPALENGDFSAIAQSFNRMSAELYYRFPVNKNLFGLTRFSFSADHDARNGKKVLDSGSAMAAFKLGPVNTVTEGKIVWLNHDMSANTGESGLSLDSFKISQNLTWTIHGTFASGKGKKTGSGKKNSYSVQFSGRTSYEKAAGKEGIWAASLSASFKTGKNRFTVKTATDTSSKKWEFTLSWHLLF